MKQPTKTKSKSQYLYNDSDFSRALNIVDWEKDLDLYGRSPFWRDYARLIHSPSYRRLKGKTQLFPGFDSDFFRCRLTHSIEVGQIGKSIANFLNRQLYAFYDKKGYSKKVNPSRDYINTDLIEFACYAHDLGHPPFGHQGEMELDSLMKEYGGFEGNAQTLRILAKLEKKYRFQFEGNDINNTGFSEDGDDYRAGLALTYRSLASILKYDKMIPKSRKPSDKLEKGYYYTEADLVRQIKGNILGNEDYTGFRTIECSIMDIADDIAYSIYDLEDAFKAGFTNPIQLFSEDDEILEKVVEKVKETGEKINVKELINCDVKKVRAIIFDYLSIGKIDSISFTAFHQIIRKSIKFAENGYLRNDLTTKFVTDSIKNVVIDTSNPNPCLWTATFKDNERLLTIEVLKRLTYQFQISSPKLKILEYRGRKIIRDIFEVLANDSINGWEFLPSDVGNIYVRARKNGDSSLKYRIICDFIASMTDNYALEYRNRLYSSNFTTIHKKIY